MIVLVIENATEKLRGKLTRWFMEAKPGVFVGSSSKVVREKLWQEVCDDPIRKGALLFSSSDTEQGFSIQMCGEPTRRIIDVDGIQLIEVTDT